MKPRRVVCERGESCFNVDCPCAKEHVYSPICELFCDSCGSYIKCISKKVV